MANWREQAALAVSGLIELAAITGAVLTTDIRAKADFIKTHSADTSSLEASAIAQKIRDDIKVKRPDIPIK